MKQRLVFLLFAAYLAVLAFFYHIGSIFTELSVWTDSHSMSVLAASLLFALMFWRDSCVSRKEAMQPNEEKDE